MRIKLEAFEETLLVTLTQDVTGRSIQILTAGLQKYVRPQTRAIYVDFTQCELSEDAKVSLAGTSKVFTSHSKSSEGEGKENVSQPPPECRLVLIGPDSTFYDALTLEVALGNSAHLESKLILELIRIQKQVAALVARKDVLVKTLGKAPEDRKLSLFKLNVALKRISSVLTDEIKNKSARVSSLKRRVVQEPKSLEEVNGRKSSLMAVLVKMGLIGT